MEFLEVAVLVISFLVLLLLGVPVAFTIGIATVLTMLMTIQGLPALTTAA
jgi:hypothetical protein